MVSAVRKFRVGEINQECGKRVFSILNVVVRLASFEKGDLSNNLNNTGESSM